MFVKHVYLLLELVMLREKKVLREKRSTEYFLSLYKESCENS